MWTAKLLNKVFLTISNKIKYKNQKIQTKEASNSSNAHMYDLATLIQLGQFKATLENKKRKE
jgi:hypothetical protein